MRLQKTAVMSAVMLIGVWPALARAGEQEDIAKGRRTETDFINGYVHARGAEIGVDAALHGRMNELVKRVERGLVPAGAEHIAGW